MGEWHYRSLDRSDNRWWPSAPKWLGSRRWITVEIPKATRSKAIITIRPVIKGQSITAEIVPTLRKASTKTHIICRDGPLHGKRLKAVFKVSSFNQDDKRAKREITLKPESLPIPGWRGWYQYDEGSNEYQWQEP